jgi:hypothetical protein
MNAKRNSSEFFLAIVSVNDAFDDLGPKASNYDWTDAPVRKPFECASRAKSSC